MNYVELWHEPATVGTPGCTPLAATAIEIVLSTDGTLLLLMHIVQFICCSARFAFAILHSSAKVAWNAPLQIEIFRWYDSRCSEYRIDICYFGKAKYNRFAYLHCAGLHPTCNSSKGRLGGGFGGGDVSEMDFETTGVEAAELLPPLESSLRQMELDEPTDVLRDHFFSMLVSRNEEDEEGNGSFVKSLLLFLSKLV